MLAFAKVMLFFQISTQLCLFFEEFCKLAPSCLSEICISVIICLPLQAEVKKEEDTKL